MRRPLLLPFVPLYAAGQALQNALRRPPRRLGRTVLSVGSLSAGGAGKTPVVEALADLLQRHGYKPAILSRGYGRGSGVAEKVDPAGTAVRFGDEPLQMAQSGLEVYVGADRYAAGRLAEDEAGPDLSTLVHVLDDGFQHRRLHRTLDVVLLTAAEFADHLLPAGDLREPLRAFRRADILLLRSGEAEFLRPLVSRHLRGQVKPCMLLDHSLTLPWSPSSRPQRPVAFCALARPESFFADLRALPLRLAGAVPFPDHHPYTPDDIAKLCRAAAHVSADAFLTTAKDAVKLTPPLRAALQEVAPLHTIPLHVSFPDEPALWSLIAPALGADGTAQRGELFNR